jgi:hypothetical protein
MIHSCHCGLIIRLDQDIKAGKYASCKFYLENNFICTNDNGDAPTNLFFIIQARRTSTIRPGTFSPDVIYSLYGQYNYVTNKIHLVAFVYRLTSSDDLVTISLDGREITREEVHSAEVNYDMDLGVINVYYDKNLIVHIPSLTISDYINHVYYFQEMSTHPGHLVNDQWVDNSFLGTDIYVGETRDVSNIGALKQLIEEN